MQPSQKKVLLLGACAAVGASLTLAVTVWANESQSRVILPVKHQLPLVVKKSAAHGAHSVLGDADAKSVVVKNVGEHRIFRLACSDLFDRDMARLTPKGQSILRAVAGAVRDLGPHPGRIDCFSDSVGFDVALKKLTLARAEAAKQYLIAQKLLYARLYDCRGWGGERRSPQQFGRQIIENPRDEKLPIWLPGAADAALDVTIAIQDDLDLDALHDAETKAREAEAASQAMSDADKMKVERDVNAEIDEAVARFSPAGVTIDPKGRGHYVPIEESATVMPKDTWESDRANLSEDDRKKALEAERKRNWERNEFGVWKD